MYSSAGYHETNACMWITEEVSKAETILMYQQVLKKSRYVPPSHKNINFKLYIASH